MNSVCGVRVELHLSMMQMASAIFPLNGVEVRKGGGSGSTRFPYQPHTVSVSHNRYSLRHVTRGGNLSVGTKVPFHAYAYLGRRARPKSWIPDTPNKRGV